MPKQKKRIYNCLPSQDSSQDWTFEAAQAAGVVDAGSAPTAVDLRKSWWKVGDQKSTGSCVGWAVADSVIRWHMVQKNHLAKSDKALLSMRYLWMAAKETDVFIQRPTTFIETDGTSLKAALDIARRYGVVLGEVLPFNSKKLYQKSADTFYLLAAQRRIASYVNLGRDVSRWREWIANNGPIAVRLDVDDDFQEAKASTSKLKEYKHPGQPKGHAVALVGYNSKHFVVRNSWGTHWGDKGFIYADDAYAKAAFTEAYGVVVV